MCKRLAIMCILRGQASGHYGAVADEGMRRGARSSQGSDAARAASWLRTIGSPLRAVGPTALGVPYVCVIVVARRYGCIGSVQGGKRRRTPRRQDAAYGVSGGLPFGGEGGERGGGEGGGAVVARPSSGGDDVRATEAVARQLAEDEVELGPEGQAQRAASVRGGAASLSDGR